MTIPVFKKLAALFNSVALLLEAMIKDGKEQPTHMPNHGQKARDRRSGLTIHASPTKELQLLYNNWRDAERNEVFDAYLRPPPEGHGKKGENHYAKSDLKASGLEKRTADVSLRDVAKRRRTGRHTAAQLAKAAFKRNLGACLRCHQRKVEASMVYRTGRGRN